MTIKNMGKNPQDKKADSPSNFALEQDELVIVHDQAVFDTQIDSKNADLSSSRKGSELAPVAVVKDENVTEEIVGGQYKLIEKLGSGASGSVFKAQHLILNKIVAIKLLPTEHQADDRVVQRFQREAQAASQLDHPNLVRVLEFGLNAGVTPYLVMDLVEGMSLSEMLSQKGRLSALRATELALQVCAGLAHAHKKGIVHRDIKPSNIIITTDQDGNEIAKIVDFGIAKILPKENEKSHTLTVTGEIMGTPLYMSPEQWAGKELDERSDIYSLGCVLYEMVAGKPAVKAASVLEAMMTHAGEWRPDFVNVTVLPYLRTIIEKCLRREPAKRFTSVSHLYKALARSSREDLVAWLGRLDLTLEESPIFKFSQFAQTRMSAWCLGFISGFLLMVAVLAIVFVQLNRAFLEPDWSSSINLARQMTKECHYDAALYFYDQAELAALRAKNNQHVIETLEEKAALFKAHPIPKEAPHIQLYSDLQKPEPFDK